MTLTSREKQQQQEFFLENKTSMNNLTTDTIPSPLLTLEDKIVERGGVYDN